MRIHNDNVVEPGSLVFPMMPWSPCRRDENGGTATHYRPTGTHYPPCPGMVLAYDDYEQMCHVLTEHGAFWAYVLPSEVVCRYK